MTVRFDLEKPIFSSDSQDEVKLPSPQLITMYDREYSLVLNEARQFFAQCKQAIYRFLSMNQFGIGFNLPLMLANLMKIEANTISDVKRQPKKTVHEGKFEQILDKMGEVISELLCVEMEIKQAYLGHKISVPTKTPTKTPVMPYELDRQSQRSMKSSQKSQSASLKKFLVKLQQQSEQEQEKSIRQTLHKKLDSPDHSQTIPKFCRIDYPPPKNLDNLSNKIDLMCKQINSQKQKDKKSFQNYEMKKSTNTDIGFDLTNCTMEIKQKNKHQINDMISCRKIVKKNEKLLRYL